MHHLLQADEWLRVAVRIDAAMVVEVEEPPQTRSQASSSTVDARARTSREALSVVDVAINQPTKMFLCFLVAYLQ